MRYGKVREIIKYSALVFIIALLAICLTGCVVNKDNEENKNTNSLSYYDLTIKTQDCQVVLRDSNNNVICRALPNKDETTTYSTDNYSVFSQNNYLAEKTEIIVEVICEQFVVLDEIKLNDEVIQNGATVKIESDITIVTKTHIREANIYKFELTSNLPYEEFNSVDFYTAKGVSFGSITEKTYVNGDFIEEGVFLTLFFCPSLFDYNLTAVYCCGQLLSFSGIDSFSYALSILRDTNFYFEFDLSQTIKKKINIEINNENALSENNVFWVEIEDRNNHNIYYSQTNLSVAQLNKIPLNAKVDINWYYESDIYKLVNVYLNGSLVDYLLADDDYFEKIFTYPLEVNQDITLSFEFKENQIEEPEPEEKTYSLNIDSPNAVVEFVCQGVNVLPNESKFPAGYTGYINVTPNNEYYLKFIYIDGVSVNNNTQITFADKDINIVVECGEKTHITCEADLLTSVKSSTTANNLELNIYATAYEDILKILKIEDKSKLRIDLINDTESKFIQQYLLSSAYLYNDLTGSSLMGAYHNKVITFEYTDIQSIDWSIAFLNTDTWDHIILDLDNLRIGPGVGAIVQIFAKPNVSYTLTQNYAFDTSLKITNNVTGETFTIGKNQTLENIIELNTQYTFEIIVPDYVTSAHIMFKPFSTEFANAMFTQVGDDVFKYSATFNGNLITPTGAYKDFVIHIESFAMDSFCVYKSTLSSGYNFVNILDSNGQILGDNIYIVNGEEITIQLNLPVNTQISRFEINEIDWTNNSLTFVLDKNLFTDGSVCVYLDIEMQNGVSSYFNAQTIYYEYSNSSYKFQLQIDEVIFENISSYFDSQDISSLQFEFYNVVNDEELIKISYDMLGYSGGMYTYVHSFNSVELLKDCYLKITSSSSEKTMIYSKIFNIKLGENLGTGILLQEISN